ncbi:hypothetical protein PT974_04313 [Cladobotryum mycophilum]|uniref:Uncharacterized protein n=1 Tax=Cladobotryum mycophilum TaxID=491253 RepID=A0ABR0SVW4_9HYPO
MPTTQSNIMSRRESWPPTQVRLSPTLSFKQSKGEPRPLLEDIDENPLTYFLTPTAGDDDDDDEMDLDDDSMFFDAGIEDASQPREIVRSVSPSSLEGLCKSNGRAMSPDLDSDVPTTDDDDDEEYIRFSPSNTVLSPLHDLAIDGLRFRARSPVFNLTTNALLSPNSIPAPNRRGRSSSRTLRRQTRSLSARSRPNHLWREPSPDVWSIEEETEEELMSDAGSDAGFDSNGENMPTKPKKRVRFVLPVRE